MNAIRIRNALMQNILLCQSLRNLATTIWKPETNMVERVKKRKRSIMQKGDNFARIKSRNNLTNDNMNTGISDTELNRKLLTAVSTFLFARLSLSYYNRTSSR